jgi:hypothetical protein
LVPMVHVSLPGVARPQLLDHREIEAVLMALDDGLIPLPSLVDTIIRAYCVDLDVLDEVIRARFAVEAAEGGDDDAEEGYALAA